MTDDKKITNEKPTKIDMTIEELTEKAVHTKSLGTIKKPSKITSLPKKTSILGTTINQPDLFHVDKQIEFENIEMGVLENGMPYLTGRGLARICGIDHAPFHRLTTNWIEEKSKPRGLDIQKLLTQLGYTDDVLYVNAEFKGRKLNAFTEPVCLALLEYYAFVAEEKRETALQNFRLLARTSFRVFVYQAVGYSPQTETTDAWKNFRHFNDRVSILKNSVPFGYFSIFQEIAGMVIDLINMDIPINDKTIPDISVGSHWGRYWENIKYSHDDRIKYEHNYPEYFPQAVSNPQHPWAYPNSALGDFRDWLMATYLIHKFPKYITSKIDNNFITEGHAKIAIEGFSDKMSAITKAVK